MLRIRLICVGRLKERFYQDAFQEYRKRLGAFCSFELVELGEERLPDRPSEAEVAAALKKEAVQIEKQILKDGRLICLCIEGRQYKSEEFSAVLAEQEASGHPRITFVIGSSCGMSPEIKQRADLRLSMSEMTFPHHLARIMLMEQIYRGFQIREGSRYHK